MPDINWEPFTTLSTWFFEATQLSYHGRIVRITAVMPDEVELFNGNTHITLPISVATVAALKPTGNIQPDKTYKQDIS